MSEKTPIKVIYDDNVDLRSTRDLIMDFSSAFKRPINFNVVRLTVTERELLGKLIFEECVEYLTKGLGLKITVANVHDVFQDTDDVSGRLQLELDEGQPYDPIESADGLGDMNVVIHFNSLWHGFNLDDVTREIHESNMSKLDEDGAPIINECKYPSFKQALNDPQYWGPGHDAVPADVACCNFKARGMTCTDPSHLIDPTRPAGKILKGPNFRKPNIAKVIGLQFTDCWDESCPERGKPHMHQIGDKGHTPADEA